MVGSSLVLRGNVLNWRLWICMYCTLAAGMVGKTSATSCPLPGTVHIGQCLLGWDRVAQHSFALPGKQL